MKRTPYTYTHPFSQLRFSKNFLWTKRLWQLTEINPTLKLNTSTTKLSVFLRTAFLLASLALLVYLLKWSIERTCSRCSRSKLDRCHRTTRCRSWTDSLTSTATVSTHNTLCTCWRACVKQRVDVNYFRKSRCYNKGWTISLIKNCASDLSILRHSPLCDHLEQALHLSQET